jgi:hypothetical protein
LNRQNYDRYITSHFFCRRIKCLLLNVRLACQSKSRINGVVGSQNDEGLFSDETLFEKKFWKTWNIFILIDRRKSTSQLAPVNFKRFFFVETEFRFLTLWRLSTKTSNQRLNKPQKWCSQLNTFFQKNIS